ncbi:2-phospho-L-lactate guanylyltransferase [Ancylobacter amanitiformis]|uniref:3-phospho-D-glycerate guanylyltransferase n=1 Tax=Ancylobacter amanitiformis TaxID=217069 RepID=A0ABU0LNB6_9HYPH|nr:2-phospho-L-lactate guanylyltransferase [Ancylobacter amanitiformis]MDQ0510103.1 2-phospho-L-lactate guanylyltransferase [Ancylobacter amanitiformis]
MSAARAGRDILAVVPVKDFALAKQRLSGAFPPSFRHALARAMLCDVLIALRGAEAIAGIVVVTADPEAGLLAGEYGARLLFEGAVRGLNPAVAQAGAYLAAERRSGMLVVPSDIPAVTSDEIARLVAAHPPGRAVSVVPAHDREGTNALVVSPPDGLRFSFGPLSFPMHLANAREAQAALQVHELAQFPGLARDIDRPEDLARLDRLPPGSHTRRLLAEQGMA